MCPIALHPSKKHLAYYLYRDSYQLIFHNKHGVISEILNKAFDQLEVLRSYYSKVTVILLQLHQAFHTKNSEQLTIMLSKLKAKLQKHYGSKVGYFWVREQNQAESQHYHMAIMVNGHKCQHSKLVDLATQTYWENRHPDNFSFRVRNRIYRVRNDDNGKELRAVRMRMSYMAKQDGKTQFTSHTKTYGYSKLRIKQ
ncbi:YagK/YfjJ domain-containing protein [Vibrio parahaemolyticus]|uniref:YagK/YfjJ domain-containing protein n=1 Tax=Vibrio parahaemolyticus TaxID=670 RepID=UPI000411C736|nr:inovirus-type Gp2 protein [Vibrio parahaemolyticus]